jgi:hypothetical protein
MAGQTTPELVVKFWPPSISAKGVHAINAVCRPLAFAIYVRSAGAILIGLALIFSGYELLPIALRLLTFW